MFLSNVLKSAITFAPVAIGSDADPLTTIPAKFAVITVREELILQLRTTLLSAPSPPVTFSNCTP